MSAHCSAHERADRFSYVNRSDALSVAVLFLADLCVSLTAGLPSAISSTTLIPRKLPSQRFLKLIDRHALGLRMTRGPRAIVN
jgi:hypothetical protein